jgi:hypothetical protein
MEINKKQQEQATKSRRRVKENVKCEGGEGGDNIYRKKTRKVKELKENSNREGET